MAQLTTKEALKLIELVEQNPILYNNHGGQNAAVVNSKKEAWLKIGNALQKPETVCKNRWASIRDHMRRKMRERTRQTYPYNKPVNKYKYEDHLGFLLPYLKLKDENVENEFFNNEERAMKTEEIFLDDDSIEIKSDSSGPSDVNNLTNNKTFTVSNSERSTESTTAFLDAVGSTLRNLNPYYLNLAKSKIFQVVQESELQQIINKGQQPDDDIDRLASKYDSRDK